MIIGSERKALTSTVTAKGVYGLGHGKPDSHSINVRSMFDHLVLVLSGVLRGSASTKIGPDEDAILLLEDSEGVCVSIGGPVDAYAPKKPRYQSIIGLCSEGMNGRKINELVCLLVCLLKYRQGPLDHSAIRPMQTCFRKEAKRLHPTMIYMGQISTLYDLTSLVFAHYVYISDFRDQ